MKKIIDNFVELFNKDTTGEGESKKLVVVMRIMEFAIVFYALINLVYCGVNGYYDALECFGIVFLVFSLLIYLSFRISTKSQIFIVNASALLCVVGGYLVLGPNTAVQSFFVVLVVLCYFSGYGFYKQKAVYAIVVCAIFIMLQVITPDTIPSIPLPLISLKFLQGMNIAFSFLCTGFICHVYSRDSQHLEGKLLEYNNILKKQAATDPLTGLCNRRSAIEFMDKLIKNSYDKGFSVCMCDIDFFKKINDSYGHDIGDNVLRGVASEMLNGFPKDCLISRWGGEEFLVIFPNMNGDDAKMILDIMRTRIKNLRFRVGEKEFGITITYGLAEYGYTGDADTIAKEADAKLYIGKENGRDQVVF